jgi:hypothetical protein
MVFSDNLNNISVISCRSVLLVIAWQFDLQLPMQSVPIATENVISIPAQAMCTRCNII